MEYAPHVQRHWFCRICGLLTHGCDPITALRFNYHFEKSLSIGECIEKNRYFCIILINKKQNYAFILIFMPVGSRGDKVASAADVARVADDWQLWYAAVQTMQL